MITPDRLDRLVGLRRELHRHPEPAWREFYTTARIVEEVRRIGVDELYIGADAVAVDARGGVPSDAEEIDAWWDEALAAGSDSSVLEHLTGGVTGVVAVLDTGPGPHVALRVDIDALLREEATTSSHRPVAEGFRSEREGAMHACGHDAHVAIGVGVLEEIATGDFSGRFTVCFQPAEEEIGGGRAMAQSGHLDDVDYLFAIHVGLDHPTGEIVGGIDGFLAVSNISATFHGEGAHAGAKPEEGQNAVLALAAAVQGMHGIAPHSDGITRVNVGRVEGGSASNIVPERATLYGEVRGESTPIREYMKDRVQAILHGAAEMHDCAVEIEVGPEAPSAQSDRELARVVETAAEAVSGVTSILPSAHLGASEDATFLMRHVQERGGLATYVGIGTDHPGGHHSATFDVDEESIRIGVEVLVKAISATETMDR